MDRATELLLTRIQEKLVSLDEVILSNLRDDILDKIETIEFKLDRLESYLHSIGKLDLLLKNLEELTVGYSHKIQINEQKFEDVQEKLTDNMKRINEMSLELKGVIAQSRAHFAQRKEFSKSLAQFITEQS